VDWAMDQFWQGCCKDCASFELPDSNDQSAVQQHHQGGQPHPAEYGV
jgi:hypothetical protein